MNLGKLLATGKSIISGRAAAKYRENKRVYLPKFPTPRNPFNASALAGPGITPDLPVAAKPASSLVEVKTRPLPTMPESKPEKTERAQTAGWVKKISSVAVWRGWQAEAKAQHRVVQGELSLDAVRVMHNDLSDADVEVVPIKSRTAPSTKVLTISAPETEKSWELTGEPLLKVH